MDHLDFWFKRKQSIIEFVDESIEMDNLTFIDGPDNVENVKRVVQWKETLNEID